MAKFRQIWSHWREAEASFSAKDRRLSSVPFIISFPVAVRISFEQEPCFCSAGTKATLPTSTKVLKISHHPPGRHQSDWLTIFCQELSADKCVSNCTHTHTTTTNTWRLTKINRFQEFRSRLHSLTQALDVVRTCLNYLKQRKRLFIQTLHLYLKWNILNRPTFWFCIWQAKDILEELAEDL